MKPKYNMKKFMKKGFTLIELLVTIGLIAIIAAFAVALINPADKALQASDAKVANDIGQIATAVQSYTAQNNGNFPATTGALVTSELSVYPVAPDGYNAYTFDPAPSGCTTACTSVVVTGQLKSAKYVGGTTVYDTWRGGSAGG